MDIALFLAGQWKQGYQYRYFLPEYINHTFTWDDASINELLEQASLKLGELNAYARLVPDTEAFIRMHVVKEAVGSSRIEGTQTAITEALLPKQDVLPERRDDWQEVNNYIEAMNYALNLLKDLPLSNRLLRQTHALLLQGVRGEQKLPGNFRTSQNWIGGATLSDAVFIPPHHDNLVDLMADLELFLHNTDIKVPHLIKIAIAHYQFETIHPFLDGNGRLGRLLIGLYLVSNNIIEKPLLYVSDFFERHRSLYYDNLMHVRTNNDLRQWLLFFLTAIRETATQSTATLQAIIELKSNCEYKILSLGRRTENALLLFKQLFSTPTLQVQDVTNLLNCSSKSASQLIVEFEKMGILVEVTSKQRYRVFSFKSYIDLFER